MATSTSPIPAPPHLKSVEEKLEEGLRKQEALRAKEKARKKSEKNDRKRKREDGDAGKASWLITPNAKDGAIPLDLATAMQVWNHRMKEKRNARTARKRIRNEARMQGSSLTAAKREAPTINLDEVENQIATSKGKTKAKATPQVLEMEFNQNASRVPSQEPREYPSTSPENVHLKAMAATQKISESLLTSKPKPKGAPTRITIPDHNIKSDLLLQTILKGRQNAGSSKSDKRTKSAAFTSDKSHSLSPGNGVQGIVAKQIKARKLRKSQTKTQLQVDNSVTQTLKSQDSFSQIVELIKISSTAKLQKLFDGEHSAPRRQLDFFDDEPLKEKKEKMLATAAWPLTKPINPVRYDSFYPGMNTTKSIAADKRYGKTAALEGWEAMSGKVRGIVGAHPDEDPEENIAFSSTYISSRVIGVQIRDSAFNTLSLRPGKEFGFKVDKRYSLKFCSVACGRVEVALGKLDFGITEGGMWRIKGKEYCVAKNNGEKVAVLHVSAMP